MASLSPGSLASVLAVAFRSVDFIGTLMAEAAEEIDPAQAEAMKSTGAGAAKVLMYGSVPQVITAYFVVTILRWDTNIRQSTALGPVGAGGVWLILQGTSDMFTWRQVATIQIASIVVVMLGEIVSTRLRRKVLDQASEKLVD